MQPLGLRLGVRDFSKTVHRDHSNWGQEGWEPIQIFRSKDAALLAAGTFHLFSETSQFLKSVRMFALFKTGPESSSSLRPRLFGDKVAREGIPKSIPPETQQKSSAHMFVGKWGQQLACVVPWGVVTGIAKPHIKACIPGAKCLRACGAIGHPSNGRIEHAMHKEGYIPSSCTSGKSLSAVLVIGMTR